MTANENTIEKLAQQRTSANDAIHYERSGQGEPLLLLHGIGSGLRGCSGCHGTDGGGRGPSLAGLFGRTFQSPNGAAKIDEAYLREAILAPRPAKAGAYPVAMPAYQGQLNEEQLLNLVAYIRSLGGKEQAQP